MIQGGLFTTDYLTDGVKHTPAWKSVTLADAAELETDLKAIFAAFPTDGTPSETRTEDDLIWPVLKRLGWNHHVRQQALSAKGRENIPDGLLFGHAEAKARADKRISFEKYEDGLCVVESKKWKRVLDRPGKSKDETETPSSQILRYLKRLEDLTKAKLRWGILTNGKLWRLYYQGAKSVAEDFCEFDLPAILGLEGHTDPTTGTPETRKNLLKVFSLIFRRTSFVASAGETRTFLETSLAEGKHYEEKVAADLSRVVFEEIFPALCKAIAEHDPDAPAVKERAYLMQVKEASLILLYRLLFVLYAEDRNLLPVLDQRYDDYGMRKRVRGDVALRVDANDMFAAEFNNYWDHSKRLFKAISTGANSIGLPPYNGGLFNAAVTPMLDRVGLPDSLYAPIIDKLSRLDRKYINYRDLTVRQLGSIYEKLLEFDVVLKGAELDIQLNPFARKGSGSYYTPDELVRLIIERTVGPLVRERIEAFAADNKAQDPAEAILDLKVCDPAMGSGHFLVDLVDYLADRVIEATVESVERAKAAGYISPLIARIESIRAQIMDQARANGWAVRDEQLDDRLIVRRMVLKRVIYGVDKNPMAVELAKVALWLHTFTVGAPLSFLDHHLRCGDSLFGETVRGVMDNLDKRGGLLQNSAIQQARNSTPAMEAIEDNTDADIAGVKSSASSYEVVREATAPLASFMSLHHAFQWLDLKGDDKKALSGWYDGAHGNALDIAQGTLEPSGVMAERFSKMLRQARALTAQEHYHHWQIAFPGVWSDWESREPSGGFDAVIGNPPWDRIKFQEVEWFAARKPEIAHADTAAKRKRMIGALRKSEDPLTLAYDDAAARAEAMLRMARESGAYPLLSGGDVNIYSLFVERALSLVKPEGLVGLLTPSGIASDKTASAFFRSISTTNRLAALFDFENRKVFFPDVHASFKFCALVMGGKKRVFEKADCSFYLHKVEEIADPTRAFALTSADFALVNPNTGTAPIFRNKRDAELTTQIYRRTPVLVDRSTGEAKAVWPVKYLSMFHMTNDSDKFRSKAELEKLGAYPIGSNRWKKAAEEFVPLYVGRMIHQYDHRASSVEVNAENLHNPALSGEITSTQKADPAFLPTPQFWVPVSAVEWPHGQDWAIGFRDIARGTDARTMIAGLIPKSGVGNTAPLILPETQQKDSTQIVLFYANLNSICLDFVARQKTQSTHLNWYLVEQLPVIPPAAFSQKFGSKTAAEIVKAEVLALTFTAHDMEPFARDMGYDGAPFKWNEMDRLKRRAKLDALYFILYGIVNRDDVSYIYSTFPIVKKHEEAAHGGYLSRYYCLMYMNALEAGDPDADVRL